MILATTTNDGTTGLIKKFKGTTLGTGTAGSNSANSKSFVSVEVVGSNGLGVQAADRLHVYGVGVFDVTSTPSAAATTLAVSPYILEDVTGKAFEILRGGMRSSQLADIQTTSAGGHVILYDPYVPLSNKGFLSKNNTGQACGTSYAASNAVALGWTGTLNDSGASEPHDKVRISHLELTFSSAGSVSGVDFALTWDAAGNEIALGPTTSTLTPFTALTASNQVTLSSGFGEQMLDFTTSSAVAGKKLYLHVKLTGGTGQLDTARLYWFL
jgi:hypothetical protein